MVRRIWEDSLIRANSLVILCPALLSCLLDVVRGGDMGVVRGGNVDVVRGVVRGVVRVVVRGGN